MSNRLILATLNTEHAVLVQSAYENLDVKTYSHPNAFPSSLRQKRALVQGHKDDGTRQKDDDPVVRRLDPTCIWSGMVYW